MNTHKSTLNKNIKKIPDDPGGLGLLLLGAGELATVVHPPLLVQDDPLLLHQPHPLLLHLVGLVRQPEPCFHVLGNHGDVVVAHVRHADDLEVLVLQDDLVVVLHLT